MKNLITGGAGFIGSHLAEALLDKGNKVTIVDNLSTGSIDNIRHLKSHPNFSCHIDTIMNKSLMKQIASASGGEYADVDRFPMLAEKILSRKEMQIRSHTRTQEFELWNLPTFLTAIVLLLGVEWLLRKQNGML